MHKTKRKKLRNNLTPAEAALWNLLKNSQLEGRKFRRQHSVGFYILDFYCPSERMAIELDGAQTIADAIMDRLIHNVHRLELKGESLQKNKNIKSKIK